MLDANNFVFLIEFDADYNGSYIVNTETKNNGLAELAQSLKERKKLGRQSFKVYQFDRSKRKFTKISMQKFKSCTDFCTELNIVLNELF